MLDRHYLGLPLSLLLFISACGQDDTSSNETDPLDTGSSPATGPIAPGQQPSNTGVPGASPSPTPTPTSPGSSPSATQSAPGPSETTQPSTEMSAPDVPGMAPTMPESTGVGGTGGTSPTAAGGAGGAPDDPAPAAGGVPAGGAGGMDSMPTPGGSGICAAGESYGDPLEGMGAVMEIGPPTQGPMTYFAFIEGPVWIASLGTLFFSDNASSPAEVIWKLVPPSTTPELFMEASGSNGLAVDANDQLILADQRAKRITRVDPTTAMVTDTLVPAGNYQPNDLQMRSDGNLYFTDPNSAGRGFYRVSPAGEVTGPLLDVNAPNGVVLSPDENTLYVGDVQNREIRTFALASDGAVDTASGTLFATTQGATLDGMAVDCAGNIYAGTANGVEVFSPSGDALGVVPTGESSNATFGGSDRRTLYVTSRSVLKAVTLAVPGLPD